MYGAFRIFFCYKKCFFFFHNAKLRKTFYFSGVLALIGK